MPKYFDVHSHLNFPDYQNDLDDVIKRLKDTETHTIVVGTDYESSAKGVDLAGRHSEIYACIGVHPVDNPRESFEVEKFEKLVSHPKVVAIGECGLDFFHPPRVGERQRVEAGAKKETDYDRQRKLFLDQINFAVGYDKPIMIHARDAYEEILEILESLKAEYGNKLRGNVHFFAGDAATANRFFNIGFTVSFTGVITFTRDYDEVVKSSPIEMLMSETDAPYVAPVPYRGKRNEPAFVGEVVKRIALIRGEDEERVRATLVSNALRMIG